MLGFNVFGADSLTEAKFRATSTQQAFVNLRSGRPSQLPPPVEGDTERLGPQERAILDQVLSCASIGTPEMVRADLRSFVERTGADELMITCQIFDHAARLRSLEIAAEAFTGVEIHSTRPI
jgi:alkanesulfonate monooxygenase SsuD/methylene tetrahydromethanopterin reductase-like flavin-dependent oxidoreductase (luciferase family)